MNESKAHIHLRAMRIYVYMNLCKSWCVNKKQIIGGGGGVKGGKNTNFTFDIIRVVDAIIIFAVSLNWAYFFWMEFIVLFVNNDHCCL